MSSNYDRSKNDRSRQPSEHAQPTPQMLGSGQARRAAEGAKSRNERTRRGAEDAMAAMPWNQKRNKKDD